MALSSITAAAWLPAAYAGNGHANPGRASICRHDHASACAEVSRRRPGLHLQQNCNKIDAILMEFKPDYPQIAEVVH